MADDFAAKALAPPRRFVPARAARALVAARLVVARAGIARFAAGRFFSAAAFLLGEFAMTVRPRVAFAAPVRFAFTARLIAAFFPDGCLATDTSLPQ